MEPLVMIVLIGGEKGGTGKTTLATNVAGLRARQDGDVLLVDTDKQGSASDWAAVREEVDREVSSVPCVQVFGKQVASQVQDLAQRYDDLIVDAGGRDSVELRSAMVVADRFFVPMQASQFDVWTIERMGDLVEQAQAVNAGLKASIFINRASPHPQVHESEEAQEIIEEFEHVVFSGVVIHDRIAFRRASSEGLGVMEVESPDSKACGEVNALYRAIFKQSVTNHEEAS